MKAIIKYISITFTIFLVSCSTEEKTVDDVLDDVGRGAILRTLAVPSPTFDFNDTSSSWTVSLEEQDAQDGALFSEVEVYVRLLSVNGNSDEKLVKTVTASEFSDGRFGLPRANLSLTLSNVLSTLGLQSGDFASEDQFNIRLNLKLNNGQAFTNSDVNPNIAGGQFFQSPFNYRAQFFCALTDASIFSGDYTVVADAWADYAPGDIIPVVVGEDPFTFRILSTKNPFIANTDTSYIEVVINPSDGSAIATSNEPFDYGIPIDVLGTGSVGTCTGDINLVLNFVGQAANQQFALRKN